MHRSTLTGKHSKPHGHSNRGHCSEKAHIFAITCTRETEVLQCTQQPTEAAKHSQLPGQKRWKCLGCWEMLCCAPLGRGLAQASKKNIWILRAQPSCLTRESSLEWKRLKMMTWAQVTWIAVCTPAIIWSISVRLKYERNEAYQCVTAA